MIRLFCLLTFTSWSYILVPSHKSIRWWCFGYIFCTILRSKDTKNLVWLFFSSSRLPLNFPLNIFSRYFTFKFIFLKSKSTKGERERRASWGVKLVFLLFCFLFSDFVSGTLNFREIRYPGPGKLPSNRRIFVYSFCLISICMCLSLSDDTNKIKTLNIERA